MHTFLKSQFISPAVFSALVAVGSQTHAAAELEELTVISTRTPLSLYSQGVSVSVLDRQELEDLGSDSLAEQLASQAGVYVSRSGGLGSQTSVRIRGEEGYSTLLLVDGLKILDASAPVAAPVFDNLLVNDAERVELLRGPQGMVYGSGAGGVVSVTSRRYSDGLAGDIDLKTGSDGYQRAAARLGAGSELGSIGINITELSTDGFNAQVADVSGEEDGFDNSTVHMNGDLQLGENWQLAAVIRHQESEVEYDGCFHPLTFASSNGCKTDSTLTAGRFSAVYQGQSSNHALAVSRTEYERDSYTDGVFGFNYQGEVERLEYLGQWQLLSSLNVIYGIDYEQQSEPDSTFSFAGEVEQTGAHIAVVKTTERGQYNAGVRFDDNDQYGEFFSYRLSGTQVIFDTNTGRLQLRGALNSGFRAPSLEEQSTNDHVFFDPGFDLSLEEETTVGLDVGIQWLGLNGQYLGFGVFKQVTENKIEYSNTFFVYVQESGDSESQGVELEYRLPIIESLSLVGNYTYNDTENTAGENRVRRPEHVANVGLLFTGFNDQVRLMGNWRVVKNVDDETGFPPSRVALDDYTSLDFTASYSPINALDIYLNVVNALDDDYQEAFGFNIAGRQAYAGVRYHF